MSTSHFAICEMVAMAGVIGGDAGAHVLPRLETESLV